MDGVSKIAFWGGNTGDGRGLFNITTDIWQRWETDDKYRIFIKNFVERNLKVIIGDDIIKEIKQIGELHDCIAKCSHLLKLKKDHDLYNQCLDNKLIYEKKDDIDDILGYFIFNIKSDYYISKYDLKY